jgi:hypothetical protein
MARHRLTPFFRVKLSGDRDRAHEIAEQHRQVTPFAASGDVTRFSFCARG